MPATKEKEVEKRENLPEINQPTWLEKQN